MRVRRRGLDALTMRGLAEALGVEAMSLSHHLANKEADRAQQALGGGPGRTA